MSFPHEASPNLKPFVHVPYDSVDKYLSFIMEEQLNLEIYFGSNSFDNLTSKDIVSLKNKLDYNPALTIHAPFMDLSPGAVDLNVREVTIKRFHEVLDVSETLQPEVIVFHSGYDKWKFNNRVNIWLENSLHTWEPINKRASDLGVKIAIENIFEDEPGNLQMLAEAMDSDNFGICFDTGHFNLFSRLPLQKWLGMIKPHIKELHLHDNTGNGDDHLAIGDGSFDFELLFEELKGIECAYTIEAHTIESVKKSLTRISDLTNL